MTKVHSIAKLGGLALIAMVAVLVFASGAVAQVTGQDGAVRACEADIISGLKSPASYVPFKITIYQDGVLITYDAANSFGALLRDRRACLFASDGSALYLPDDPRLGTNVGGAKCLADVGEALKIGQIIESLAAKLAAACEPQYAAQLMIYDGKFAELGVTYPVPHSSTTVRP